MALTYDEANSVQSQYYDGTLTQQVYEKSPFVTRLKSKNKIKWDGGNQIQWPIRQTALSRAEFVDPRAQVQYTQKETRTAAVLDWKYLIGQGMIQWDERVKNKGKARIINLLADKNEEILEDMLKTFTDALYDTSQDGNRFSSLDTIVDSATTYGGIAVTDAAAWAAIEDSTTDIVRKYGSGSLAYMINQATFGKNIPDLILTTRDLYSKIESLIEPQKRYSDTDMASSGFRTVKFDGITVVADYACPSGYLFGLDTDQFELRYHPDFNFKTDPWKDLMQAGFPQSLVKLCYWVGNLLCRMRKSSFKMSNLDYTK